jgi:hypothetical protein
MLGICVPVRDTMHSGFSFCLAQLTANLASNNIEFKLMFDNGSILPEQRNNLVKTARKFNCSEILWLDSDMVFPANLYTVLKSHNRSVVACTYSTRYHPHQSVAFMDKKDMTQRLTLNNGLHTVSAVGMGLMLVKMTAFSKLHRPYFSFKYDRQKETYIGEDVTFCHNLQDYDIKIFVDTDLSQKCGHLATTTKTMEDIHK